MKYQIIINKNEEEEVRITCHYVRDWFDKVEQLVNGSDGPFTITGYEKNDIVLIAFEDIICFFSQSNKVYAMVGNHTYLIKKRLYQIEEMIDDNFIKINQSCIANIKQIKKFTVSFNGMLEVIFKNDHKDYISRRELKNVKERLGIVK